MGYSVGLAVVVAGAIIAHSWVLQRDATVEAERERGRLLLVLLSERLEAATETGDEEAMEEALALTRLEPGVTDALLLDASGKVLADGLGDDGAAVASATQLEVIRRAVVKTSGDVVAQIGNRLLLAGPIEDGEGTANGLVYMELSQDRARTGVLAGVRAQITLAAVLLGAGMLLGIMVIGEVAQAIRKLREGVESMSRGRFDARVPVAGPPELETIAAQINTVAERASAATSYKTFVNNMLQSMADCLIVVDTDATIRAVNQATIDLLGYTEEQLLGQPISLVCIENGYELSMTRLQQLVGTRSRNDHEVAFRRFNGVLVPISLSGSPIRDEEDRVVGYVCLGTDITDRKNAEQERTALNKQLVEASRHAGMAEVATGVLHNVGNVLNSVTVSANVASDLLRRSRIDRLAKATRMLAEHEGDLATFLTRDEKGKMLPGYLDKLSSHLAEEQQRLLEELSSLTRNIGHIKEIIGTQQSLSKTSGVVESASPSELLEDALRMKAETLSKHRVRIVRSYADVGRVRTDQHKVLQILINLIGNACDAMESADVDERVLRVRLLHDEPGQCVRIEICDNGVGIPRQNLTKVFTHGFTTKKQGHGFGLHSAALAAKELGGALTVTSEGEGAGATFTLRLPLEAKEVAA